MGNFTRTLGQKFRVMASLMRVKEPLITAWQATMAARVEMPTPMSRNHSGITR